jgi:hypothetical protein
MGWRIYLWIVGLIVLMTHAPSSLDPAHPAVVDVARVAAFDRLNRSPLSRPVQGLRREGPRGALGQEEREKSGRG